MGHQESFVRVKDNSKFDTFFSMVKSLGKEVFEESGAYPVSLITLKKQIKGNLAMMCEPDLKYKFPAGDKINN